ncbi:hypothetical protein ABLN67_19545 [Mycobacterium tuberculosis]
MFNRFIYRREWSFRIYRETLSRFSCAASSFVDDVLALAGGQLAGIAFARGRQAVHAS